MSKLKKILGSVHEFDTDQLARQFNACVNKREKEEFINQVCPRIRISVLEKFILAIDPDDKEHRHFRRAQYILRQRLGGQELKKTAAA
jgi:hypothetical protein